MFEICDCSECWESGLRPKRRRTLVSDSEGPLLSSFKAVKPTNAKPLSIFGFELRVPNAASRTNTDLVLGTHSCLGRKHLFNREVEPIERSFKTSKDVSWVSARGKARLDLFAQLEVFFQRGD